MCIKLYQYRGNHSGSFLICFPVNVQYTPLQIGATIILGLKGSGHLLTLVKAYTSNTFVYVVFVVALAIIVL